MKKQVLKSMSTLVIASLMLVSTLSGCGNTTNDSSSSIASTAAISTATTTVDVVVEKPVTLKVINYRVEDKVFYDTFNSDFQTKYPNITVSYDAVATADFPTLRSARIASNDVDVIGSGTQDMTNKGLRASYMDLKGQPFMDNYIPDSLQQCYYQDKLLVMPINSVSFVTFYNKKMFSDNGLAVPTTWPDFVKACDTFKSKNVDPIIFAGKDQWPINMVIGQFESAIIRTALPDFWTKSRTEENKFTEAPWIEALTKLKTLSTYFQKNSSGLGYAQAPGLFAQGKAAMMIDGSWSNAQITEAKPNFDVGVFVLPTSDNADNNKASPTKIGSAWSIYVNTSNKDAALKYLDFHSQKDNYTKYIEFVKMAPVQAGVTLQDPLAQAIGEVAATQTPEFQQLMTSGGKYEFTNYTMSLIYGDLTPEKFAQNLQTDFINSKIKWVID